MFARGGACGWAGAAVACSDGTATDVFGGFLQLPPLALRLRLVALRELCQEMIRTDFDQIHVWPPQPPSPPCIRDMRLQRIACRVVSHVFEACVPCLRQHKSTECRFTRLMRKVVPSTVWPVVTLRLRVCERSD